MGEWSRPVLLGSMKVELRAVGRWHGVRLGLTGFQGLMGFPSKVGVETLQDNFTVFPAGGLQGFCSA